MINLFKIFGSLILIATCLNVSAQKLSKVKIDDEISVKLPEDWTIYDETEIRNKYISQSTPIAMYGDARREVDFSATKNQTDWHQRDMGILIDFYKANLVNLYSEINFTKEEIITVNKKSFISFEFVGTIKDEAEISMRNRSLTKYIYLRYHIENGYLYVFNISSPANLKNQVQGQAAAIMDSIVIK